MDETADHASDDNRDAAGGEKESAAVAGRRESARPSQPAQQAGPIDVTVVIATFGDNEWRWIAERAIASVEAFPFRVPFVHVHGKALHLARNEGAARAKTEWLCHLDADDELEPGYFEAMAGGTADLRAPLARYVHKDGRVEAPKVPPGSLDLRNANTLVIGTLVRKALHIEVGGFRDFPLYEDWDYFQRCWKALDCDNSRIEYVQGAVYRAHVRANSRNRRPKHDKRTLVHHLIRRTNFPELYGPNGKPL